MGQIRRLGTRGCEASCHPMRAAEDVMPASQEGLSGGVLQWGQCLGGWYQQWWQSGPGRAFKQKAIVSPWLRPVVAWEPSRDSPLLCWEWGALGVHREWVPQGEPWSTPAAPPSQRLAPPSLGVPPVDQSLLPLYSGVGGRWGGIGGISYKLFSHSQAFKKTTVSEENEEAQTTHTFRTQTPRQTDRQADPHPHPGYMTPCLIDLASLPVHTPGEGDGVATGRRTSSRTLDLYPGYQTNQDSGKEGLRREEGLCIFLYLWQTAVLAWFQLPMEASTSQPAQNPQGARGATCSCEQPACPPGLRGAAPSPPPPSH